MTEGQADWYYINKYTIPDGETDGCWYSGVTFIGDGKTELDRTDDAAAFKWGGSWRMPSMEQIKELLDKDNTTTEWTTQNGVYGRKITSIRNGNGIFLPAAGSFGASGNGEEGSRGRYLSNALDASFSDGAFYMYFGPSSTLWATRNVGADDIEDYGNYFAWGETVPKSNYNWETYKFFKIKYDYETDGLTELLPEDDAATVNWGENWQMPSYDQINELSNSLYTTTKWTTINGVNGCEITSNINGNSIFLPAAGYLEEASFSYLNEGGIIWSRSSYSSAEAYYLYFLSNEVNSLYMGRFYGVSVRPVVKQ